MAGKASVDEMLDERLAVFEDEPDINDWVETFWGVFLITVGIHQIINPGGFLDTEVMQWLGAAVIAVGIAWVGHGLKDMGVKEIRRSIVMLELTKGGKRPIDYSLIRDVLLHPEQYSKFLLNAYEAAFEDGILDQDELEELSELAKALKIPEDEAAKIATRAAINSAIADGNVTEAERVLIEGTMRPAGLDEEQMQAIRSALDDGVIDADERKMLDNILGKI